MPVSSARGAPIALTVRRRSPIASDADQFCTAGQLEDLGHRPPAFRARRIKADTGAQRPVMKDRHTQDALVVLTRHFRLKDARGTREVGNVIDHDRFARDQPLMQPTDHRHRRLLQIFYMRRDALAGPFLGVAEPQKIVIVFEHPGAIGAGEFADFLQDCRNRVVGRRADQVSGRQIGPVIRRLSHDWLETLGNFYQLVGRRCVGKVGRLKLFVHGDQYVNKEWGRLRNVSLPPQETMA